MIKKLNSEDFYTKHAVTLDCTTLLQHDTQLQRWKSVFTLNSHKHLAYKCTYNTKNFITIY